MVRVGGLLVEGKRVKSESDTQICWGDFENEGAGNCKRKYRELSTFLTGMKEEKISVERESFICAGWVWVANVPSKFVCYFICMCESDVLEERFTFYGSQLMVVV